MFSYNSCRRLLRNANKSSDKNACWRRSVQNVACLSHWIDTIHKVKTLFYFFWAFPYSTNLTFESCVLLLYLFNNEKKKTKQNKTDCEMIKWPYGAEPSVRRILASPFTSGNVVASGWASFFNYQLNNLPELIEIANSVQVFLWRERRYFDHFINAMKICANPTTYISTPELFTSVALSMVRYLLSDCPSVRRKIVFLELT